MAAELHTDMTHGVRTPSFLPEKCANVSFPTAVVPSAGPGNAPPDLGEAIGR